jgi:GH24 family phage-related lysozyme (muramidase)
MPSVSDTVLHRATALVGRYHPCLLAPYRATEGYWAIGWDSRVLPDGGPVCADSAPISPRAADALLKRTLLAIGERVLTVVPGPLADHQTAALMALVYDIGAPAFHLSLLLELLCRGAIAAAAAAFMSFVQDDDGEVLGELFLRRAAQRDIFLNKPTECFS